MRPILVLDLESCVFVKNMQTHMLTIQTSVGETLASTTLAGRINDTVLFLLREVVDNVELLRPDVNGDLTMHAVGLYNPYTFHISTAAGVFSTTRPIVLPTSGLLGIIDENQLALAEGVTVPATTIEASTLLQQLAPYAAG